MAYCHIDHQDDVLFVSSPVSSLTVVPVEICLCFSLLPKLIKLPLNRAQKNYVTAIQCLPQAPGTGFCSSALNRLLLHHALLHRQPP
jgi:hypothetical protein